MIETRKNRKSVSVRFILPDDESLGKVSVVGDFNNWTPGETLLTNGKDDHLIATVKLDKDGKYAFRYLSEKRGWFDDEAAHDYERGPFGAINCLIQT